MAEPALLTRSEAEAGRSLDVGGFRALHELTRHGYAPDADGAVDGEGLLMRHPIAPDLVLRPDGSIEVPSGQPRRRVSPSPAKPARRKRRWGRMFLILMAVTAYTMLAFLVMAIIFDG